MPEKEALPEYDWHVMLRDGSSFTVRAAYPQHGLGSVNPDSSTPVVLKDATNKVVFVAPEDWLGAIERGGRLDESIRQPTGAYVQVPPGTAFTPGQIRDLQDTLDDAAQGLGWTSRIIVLPAGSKLPGDDGSAPVAVS